MTSRKVRWDKALGVFQITLDILARPESINLLQKYREDITVYQARAIAAELGDLPLALCLARSYLDTFRHEISPEHYLQLLQENQSDQLLQYLNLEETGISYSPTSHELSVARTFALSFKRLPPDIQVDEMAAVLLAHIANFAPNSSIPRALLFKTLSPQPLQTLFDMGIHRLANLGLVTLENGLVIHPLIAQFVKSKALSEGQTLFGQRYQAAIPLVE